jgi:hypothetical protein
MATDMDLIQMDIMMMTSQNRLFKKLLVDSVKGKFDLK